jgi:CheY-like chemotaxis protein
MKKINSILLIDDDEDDNFFHKIALSEANICENIVVAESGFSGLDLIKKPGFEPELIFLDINMPKMNGWEFLAEYRKLNLKNKPIIIMLTTSMNPQDRDRSKDIPEVVDFRTKPLDVRMLKSIYHSYFDGKEAS